MAATALTPKYDPTGLEVLTSAVTGELLKEHALTAEIALGLRVFDLNENDTEEARIAVALQVNFQVEQGVDVRKFKSIRRRDRSYEHGAAAQVGIDSLAEEIAQAIIERQGSGGYAVLTAL